jgi:hypothetical protein
VFLDDAVDDSNDDDSDAPTDAELYSEVKINLNPNPPRNTNWLAPLFSRNPNLHLPNLKY